MATGNRPRTFDQLSPEEKAKVEKFRAGRKQPESTEAEVRDRELIAEELRQTGRIATTGESLDLSDDLRFRRFMGRFREHREAAGISLAVASERSGIDQGALSRPENGRSNPTVSTLQRYARAIEARMAWGFEP